MSTTNHTTKQTHTPTPWGVGDTQFEVREAHGESRVLAECYRSHNATADAAHIVRCVNLHEELIEACRTAYDNLKPSYASDHLVMRRLTEILAKATQG